MLSRRKKGGIEKRDELITEDRPSVELFVFVFLCYVGRVLFLCNSKGRKGIVHSSHHIVYHAFLIC